MYRTLECVYTSIASNSENTVNEWRSSISRIIYIACIRCIHLQLSQYNKMVLFFVVFQSEAFCYRNEHTLHTKKLNSLLKVIASDFYLFAFIIYISYMRREKDTTLATTSNCSSHWRHRFCACIRLFYSKKNILQQKQRISIRFIFLSYSAVC